MNPSRNLFNIFAKKSLSPRLPSDVNIIRRTTSNIPSPHTPRSISHNLPKRLNQSLTLNAQNIHVPTHLISLSNPNPGEIVPPNESPQPPRRSARAKRKGKKTRRVRLAGFFILIILVWSRGG